MRNTKTIVGIQLKMVFFVLVLMISESHLFAQEIGKTLVSSSISSGDDFLYEVIRSSSINEDGVENLLTEISRTQTPNPIDFEYSYDIQRNKHSEIQSVSLDAYLDPFDLYLDKTVTMKNSGQVVDFIKAKDNTLSNVEGSYAFFLKDGRNFLNYSISMTDRKFLGEDILEFDGEDLLTHVFAYTLTTKKYSKLGESSASVLVQYFVEWFSPSAGTLKRMKLHHPIHNKQKSDTDFNNYLSVNTITRLR